MDRSEAPRLQAFFRALLRRRWWIVAAYSLLLPLALILALRVERDSSIDRLIVLSDSDARNTRVFQALFPEGSQAILLAEADDPFDPAVLDRVAAIERTLGSLPRLQVTTALTLFDRAPPKTGDPVTRAVAFRRFATGTDLLRRQGLVGPDFLGIALDIQGPGPNERNETLQAIDRALAPFEAAPAPLTAIRRVGGPFVDAYLERETARATGISMPLFGLFVIAVNLALYRSVRTLVAFLATLAVCVATTVGLARVAGFSFTIVSSLVPLTILITATASLVYIQSRFTENPDGASFEAHQLFTLANKLAPTAVSILAAATGFAALAVSGIRPIREMGLWVASGLAATFVIIFTLFPALQRILATPMRGGRDRSGPGLGALIDAIPAWSFRFRHIILPLAMALMIAGLVALTGFPGRLAPMSLLTDTIDYIDRDLPLYKDTRRFEKVIGGLGVVQIRVTTPPGEVLDPEILRGIERFSGDLERDPRVGSALGPTTILKFMRYLAGAGDRLPEEPGAWPALAARLEQTLLEEPSARSYIDMGALSNARLTVIHRGDGFPHVDDLRQLARDGWNEAAARVPALRRCRMELVGQGLLQAKIADDLVPTLTESFAITAAIIFAVFVLVFRSASTRLLAMIPSLFAILVMFLVMRLGSIPLNVATILIGSTVLGASENDQIHFFHHYQEARGRGDAGEAMRHALRIAGRGIVFATLFNAAGFSALALSGLPPMRQFGVVSACAFVLSMVASLIALPAALWVVSGRRPGES